MAELLPSVKVTDKIRRKLRKLLTLNCCPPSTQQRYFKKFLKGLDKKYTALKSCVTSCVTAAANGDCEWMSSCFAACCGGGSRSDCDSKSGSRTAGYGSTSNEPGCQTWCTLAYWEERKRVGRQFPVSSNSVQVFSSLSGRLEPDCQALCLQTISARDNAKAPQSIVKARDKIGLGVVLSYSGSTVSVYNRSDIPLFVNSPTLDLPNSRNFSVYKILPGYSMKVFDFVTSKNLQTLGGAGSGNLGGGYQSADGPYDPHAVRLSFGKGWGGKYSRQIVTSCPCWLEILLVPPR